MGLDMYLEAKRYLWAYPEGNPDVAIAKGISEQFPELATFSDRERDVVKEIVAEVAYWRKANAIHNWFVENVQDGEDDCKSYYVDQDKLKELYNRVCAVLKDTSKAAELLPTTSGFFFGSTEYGPMYWNDIEDTKEKLEKVFAFLKHEKAGKWQLYYQASW